IRARSFNHLGPRQRPAFVAPALAKQVAEAEAGLAPREIRVGNLSAIRDFSDVRDVARAYRLILERGTPGEVYNVATGRGTRIRELLERLVQQARVPLAIVDDPARHRPVEIPCLIGDPARLARATDFRLDRSIDETLAVVLDDWR